MAGSQTWAGGAATWDTGTTTDWSAVGTTTPTTSTWVAGSDAVMNAGGQANINTTVSADSISDSSTALTLAGTGILQLGSGSGNGGYSLNIQGGGTNFTVNSGLTIQLMASSSWAPGNNNGLIINGNVTDAGAGTANTGFTLNINNSGGFNGKSVQLNGTNTFGALSMTGGNSLAVTLGGSTTLYGNLTISGGSAQNNDTLNVNNATLVSTTGALVINSNYVTVDTKSAGNAVTSVLAENWNGGLLTYGGTGSLNMGTGGVTLGTNVILNANSSTAANVLTIGGTISDGGNGYSLYKEGPGSVTLNGSNTYTGGTTVAQGLLTFGNSTAADTGNVTLLTGAGSVNGSTLAYGYDFSQTDLNHVVSNNAGTTIAEGSATASQNLNFTNYSNVNFGATVNSIYSGTITPGANGYLLGGGGATLTLSGTNALTGATNVTIGGGGSGGGVTLTGSNNGTGATTITGVSPAGSSANTTTLTLSGSGTDASTGFTIDQSGVLTLSNTSSANSTARIGSTAAIKLQGGTVNFNNDASNSTFAQSTGNLNVGIGSDTIGTTQAGSAGTSTLTFSGVTRTAGSTLNFTDSSIGTSTRDDVIFTTAPTLVNGIIPYATVNGNAFATYGANGITALTSYTAHAVGSWVSTDNVDITGNTTMTSNQNINSLTSNNSTLAEGGYTLYIGSGAYTSTATTAVVSGGYVTVGSSATPNVGGELIYNSSNNGNISSVIENNGTGVVSFTKGGSGLLYIGNTNTYTGGTVVDAGTLSFFTNPASLGTGLVTMAGGAIQAAGGLNSNSNELGNNFFFAPGTSSSFQANGSDFFIGGVSHGTSVSSWTGSGTINFSNSSNNSFQFNIDPSQFTGTIDYAGSANLYLNGQTSQTYMTVDGSKAHWIVNNTGNSFAWNGGAGGVVKMGDLSGSGNIQPNQNFTLEVGFLNDSTVYNGKIGNSQSTSFLKVGSGTLTLTGLNGGLSNLGGAGGWYLNGGTLASTTGVLYNIGVNFGGTGTLALTSAPSAGFQNFQTLKLNAGNATIQSIYGSGDTGTSNITFSGTSRSTGATVNFVTTGGVNGTSNIINPGVSSGFMGQDYFFNGSNYAWMNGSSTYVRGINYGTDSGSATSAGATTLASTNFQQITGAVTGQNTATFTTIDDIGSNNLTLASGQTLTDNGFLLSGGTATISGGTGIKSASGQELAINTNLSTDALTISSNILTNGGASAYDVLTKSGAGKLTLSGTNTYTGGTYINQGIVNINADAALGAVPATATTNITFSGTNSTLQFGANNITLNANRNIGIGYDETATFDTNGNNATINGSIGDINTSTYAGQTTNNGGLVNKIGSGALVLGGANSFSGGLTLTAGTLDLNNSGEAAPASQSVTLTNGGTTFTATSTAGLFVGETVSGPGLVTGTEIASIVGSTVTLTGTYQASTGAQTISFGGNSALGVGAFTINGGTTIDNTSGSAVSILTNNAQTWAGNFTFGGTGYLNMGTGAVTMLGNTTITTNGTAFLAEGGAISDGQNNYNSYSLTKNGAGTLVLSGASTYTGGTTISAGTLIAGAPGTALGTGAVNVGSNTLNYEPTVAGALTIGGLNLGSGAVLGTALGGTQSQSAITSTAVATATGSHVVNIYGIPGVSPFVGSNNLLTVASGLTSGGATYTLGNVYNATNFTVSGFTSSDSTLSITAASATALTSEYWIGGLSGATNVWAASNGSTASNWATNQAGTATPLTPGPTATINFSATGATNENPMVLGANMSILGIVDSVNDSNTLLLNADGNTLTIGTGGISVNASADALTLNAPIIMNGAQSWTNSSTHTLTSGGGINNSGNLLTLAGTGNITISGAIIGSGGLSQTGSGVATLSGTNSYTGGTTITSGTVAAASTQALGGASATLSIGNAALDAQVAGVTVGATTLTASTAIFDTSLGASLTIGALSGNFNFTKQDSGTMYLNTASTRSSGLVNVNGGTLQLGSTSGLGTTGTTITMGGGTLDLATATSVNAYNTTVTASSIIASDVATSGAGITQTLGTLAINNPSTLTVAGGANVTSGTAGLTFGATTLSAATTFNITNPTGGGTTLLTLGAVTNGTFTGTLTGNGNFAQTGAWGGGSGGLTLGSTYSGTATLSQQNTYTGATTVNGGTLSLTTGGGTGAIRGILTINSGGTVQLNTGDALGYNGGSSVSTVYINGGTLNNNVSANNAYITNFVMTGGTVSSTGGGSYNFNGTGITTNGSSTTALWSAPILIRNTSTLSVTTALGSAPGGIDLSISGNISQQNANSPLYKYGPGTLSLSGTDSYGNTVVNAGTLNLNFSGATAPTTNIISSGSAVTLAGATLSLTGKASTTNSQQINGLSVTAGANSIALTAASSNPLSLNLGAITRTTGGTIDFTLPTGTQSSTNGITTSMINTNGILGGYATVGGTDWAVNSTNAAGGNIIGLSSGAGYTSTVANGTTGYANANLDVVTPSSLGNSSAITVNSLRFNTAASDSFNYLAGTNANIISSGGILETANVGSNNSSINGSKIEGASNADLVVTQNNTSAPLTISSVIANNGTSGLTKSGAGTVVLTGANTYSGTTAVNAGTLQMGNNVSGSSIGNAITLAGGTLLYDLSSNSGVGNITLTANSTIGTIGSSGMATGNGITGNGFNLNYAGSLNSTYGTVNYQGYTGNGSFSGEWLTGGTVSNVGQINITSGDFGTSNNNNLGSSVVNVSNGASFTLWGITEGNNITLNGGAGAGGLGALSVQNGGSTESGTITLASGVSTINTLQNTLALSGVVTGSGGLDKSGYNTLTLSGTNNYTGVTIVDGGTLQLNLTSTAANSTLYNGVTANTLTIGGAPGAYAEQYNYSMVPTLSVTGASSTNNVQSFGNTVASYGVDTITATPGSSGGIVLNLGTLTHNAGANLNFTNNTPISAPSATNEITTSATTFSGLTNGILGGWATVGGTDWATVNSSDQIVALGSTGTGTYTAFASGNLVNGPTTNVKSSTATIGVAGSGETSINTLLITAANPTISIGSGGTLNLGTLGGIFTTTSSTTTNITGGTLTAGGATLGTAGELDIQNVGYSSITISSVIANNNASTGAGNSTGGGAVTLVINQGNSNSDSTQISGANTYSGGTYIVNGRVATGNNSAFGTGLVTVLDGGEAYTGNTLANNFAIEGNGTNENLGAIRLQGGTLNGSITLLADAQIDAYGGSGSMTGQITGTGNLTLTGNSTISLGNTSATNLNNWTGNTIIGTGITQLAANQLTSGAGYGNVTLNSTLELGGFNSAVNGLAGTSTIQNTSTGTPVLSIGNNNQSFAFGGKLTDGGTGKTLTVEKDGNGLVELTGTSNNYVGGTIVNSGTLQMGNSTALGTGALTVNGSGVAAAKTTASSSNTSTGGTLDLNNNSLTVASLSGSGTGGGLITSYNDTTAGALTLTVNGSASTSFNGSIQNGTATSIGLTLASTNTGTLDLTGTSTYTGGTLISGGTLELGNTASIITSGLSFGGSGSGVLSLGDSSGAYNLALTAPITGTTGSNSIVNGDTTGASTVTLNSIGTQTYANAFGGSTTTSKNLNLVVGGSSSPVSVLTASSSYNGTTTINSGATLYLNGGAITGNGGVTISTGATLQGGAGGNNSTVGIIGGAVSNSAGGGALTLAAGSGSLTVNGLTLGGSTGYSAGNAAGGYTTLNYTFGSGSNIETLDVGTAGSPTGTLTVQAGGAYISISGSGSSGDNYTLAQFSSSSIPSLSSFSLASGTAGTLSIHVGAQTYTLAEVSGGSGIEDLQLDVSGTAVPGVAYFDGNQGTVWNNVSGSSTSWSTDSLGATDAGNTPGAVTDVIFSANNGGANGTAGAVVTTMGQSTVINSLNVNTVSSSVTINQDAGQAYTLTVNGLADTNHSSDNVYTGNPSGNGINIASGAGAVAINVPVIVGGSQIWTNGAANAFNVTGSVSGTATTGNTQTLTLVNSNASSSGTTTLSGAITDGSNLGKLAVAVNNTGSGVTTFSNSGNTYSGGTTLNGGTLTSAATGGFGTGNVTVNPTNTTHSSADNATLNTTASIASTAAVTVNTEASDSGYGIGTINFNDTTPTIGSLAGNGNVVLNNASGTTLTVGSSNNLSSTFSGVISQGAGAGTASLIKAGTGTLQLSGINSYNGSTTINAGDLQITNSSSLGNGSATNTIAMNGATLESVSGTNTLVANQAVTLSGNNTITSDAGLLTINGAVTNGTGTLTFTGAGNSTITGVIGSGSGGITKGLVSTDTGRTILSGNNSFTGATIVNYGTLQYGGTPTANTSGITINNTAILQLGSATGVSATTAISFGGNTAAQFQLNGFNYSADGNIAQGNANNIIENGGATNATLTVAGNPPFFTTFGYNELLQDGSGGGTLALNVTGNEYLRIYNNNTYSGGTTINSGSEIEDNTNTAFGTGTVTLNGGGAIGTWNNVVTNANNISVVGAGNSITAQNNHALTLTGALSSTTNSAGLTLNGAGSSVTLASTTNNNAFTGNVTIGSGTVQFANASSGSNAALWTVNGATTLNFSGDTLHLGGLTGSSTIGNGASQTGTNTIDVGERNDSSDVFSGVISNGSSATVALTKLGTGTQTLTGANTYTGATSVTGGTLAIGNGSTGSIDTTSSVSVGTPATIAFDEATGSTFALGISDSGLVVGNEDSSIINTLGGSITGGGGFTQSGAGTTILSTANSYLGVTNINAGTLQIGATNAIGSSSSVVIGSNTTSGTLAEGTFSDNVAGLQLLGGSVTGGTGGSITSASTYDLQNGTVSGVLAGSVGANIDGGATVVLSGANTFNGTTTVGAGANPTTNILNYTSGAAFAQTSAIVVTAGNTVELNGGISGGAQTLSLAGQGSTGFNGALDSQTGSNVVNSPITLTSSAMITSDGTSSVNLVGNIGSSATATLILSGASTGTNIINGNITDGSGQTLLNKFTGSTDTWILAGTNDTFTGATTIAGGALQLNTASALQNSTVSATVANGLIFNTGIGTFTLGGLSGSGNQVLADNTTPTAAAVTLQIGNNNATTSYSGTLSGAGGIVKIGTGNLYLNHANTFTGVAAVSSGSLQADVNGAFGATGATANSGGTLSFFKGLTFTVPLTLNGTGYSSRGALVINGASTGSSSPSSATGSTTTFSGQITVASNATLNSNHGTVVLSGGLVKNGTVATLTGGGTFKINSAISGSASGSDLDVTAATTVQLNSANSYNGPTMVYGGSTLQTTVAGALPVPSAGEGTVLTLGNGGDTNSVTNKLDLDGTSQSVASLNSTNDAHESNVVTDSASSTTSTLTLTGLDGNGAAASSNFGGVIQNGSGKLALTVTGGTHTLSGGNTYSGATTINGGTLNVTGSISSSAVSVANGATLSGTGSTGLVTVNGGGSIGLQNGTIGTLTVAGLSTGGSPASSFTFDIGSSLGSNDMIADNGILTLNGVGGTTITIGNATGVSSLTLGLYNLITYTGTYTGSLSNLSLSTTTLDGDLLSLVQGSGVIELDVSAGSAPKAYFNGVGNDMNTATNFDTSASSASTGGTVGAQSNVYFSADRNTSATPNLSAPLEVNSVNFGAGTGINSGIAISSSSTADTLQIDAANVNGNTNSNGISIAAGGGNDSISAPVVLGGNQSWTVTDSTSRLTVSGQVTGAYQLTKAGAGAVELSNPGGNMYSGGTTVSAGTLYVDNTSGSGTGSGAVSVTGGTLAGKGSISGQVSLTGGSLYSGGVPTGQPAVNLNTSSVTTGLTLTNTSTSVMSPALLINSANLTFALGTDTTSGGAYNYANPSYNSTYLKANGLISFSGNDTVSLVDLTNTGSGGTLTLRQGVSYVLISNSLGDAGYYGLVTTTGYGSNAVYTLDGNGFVVGDLNAAGLLAYGSDANGSVLSGFSATDVNSINIAQYGAYGATGMTALSPGAGGIYPAPALYLYNGNLEVVPEPGTWALMLGGLALLVAIQRRKSKRNC